jgi:hypothetical protein
MDDAATTFLQEPMYIVDYSSDRFYFPIPGQICYLVPFTEDSTIAKLILLKCLYESDPVKNKNNVGATITITAQQLNEDDASVMTDDKGIELPLYQVLIRYDDLGHVIWRPRFARAIKVEANPEPTNADIMSIVALSQARFHDIEQRLAQLTTQIDRLIAAKLV